MTTTQCGTPEQSKLFSALLGPIHWQLLEFTFTHQLFDRFQQCTSAEEAGNDLNWRPDRLELLLNACVALGFMHKKNAGYTVKNSYRPLLLSDSESYLGETLLHLSRIKQLTPETMLTWLSPRQEQHAVLNMRNEQFWQNATSGLQAFHQSIRNPILLPLIRDIPHWRDGLTILDLGAGSVQLARDILKQSPNSQITLFDLPPCCEVLQKEVLTDTRLASHVSVRPGDMNQGDFGGPYQLMIAAMSLYFARDLAQCIDDLWQSLAPGGTFISFHEALNTTRTQPLYHVLGRLPAELANGPLSLSHGQLEATLAANNPVSLSTYPLKTPFGEMTLIVATKGAE
ncbi:class I SAM-dependent methyltransferase [Photobacterium sp. TY1-4]|uniref:class I SAM-dependent methyltransferase n=1 Tax=Photobacterium sp. TY1-4 TaxID=2899122 RepID=UPI0021C0E508|nr:hypothetical protein [Photobacterium sp. TY1-4]UXI02722.1 hypothetical protein NH461_08175 [Photobacterium sp. TY1-4]